MDMHAIYPARKDATVQCCQCGTWAPTDAAFADLDGPAFKAFYCARCADEATQGHTIPAGAQS